MKIKNIINTTADRNQKPVLYILWMREFEFLDTKKRSIKLRVVKNSKNPIQYGNAKSDPSNILNNNNSL
jgi:hypothetical protein